MAKQSGLGDALFVAGYDLSGDIGSLGKVAGGPSTLDVTGIDKSAMERIGGRRDGGIEFTAYFNPSAAQAHERFSALPTSDQIVTYCRGTTLGNPAAACVAKEVDYAGSRGDDGAFTFKVEAAANGFGLEWGTQLTAGKRTDGAATNGTSVDMAADQPGDFGAQAYLHAFAFTGTSATVKVQTSTDNGVGDPFSDRITFTAVTGITSERGVRATGTGLVMERYARVVTTGTFSNLVFAVALMRNETAVVF